MASPSTVPRIAIIGGGSRGHSYARALHTLSSSDPPINATIAAIIDPIPHKRREIGESYIWGPADRPPHAWEEFDDYKQWISYEVERRRRVTAGEVLDEEEHGADGVMICVLDEMHVEVIRALGEAGLIGDKVQNGTAMHVLCEKPLATTLEDVMEIYKASSGPSGLFSICHVLRYSPHNMLLRDLAVERRVIGDILSVEHVEPVGWWHFSHSYVRGNWRNSATTAPSLLTKSCHDIDFLLWLLCSPPKSAAAGYPPHLPSYVSSMGSLKNFRRSRKPHAAGNATNCLSCPIESECMYSAKKIYLERHLQNGDTGWPVKIVASDIEDIYRAHGKAAAETRLLETLAEDYDASTSREEVQKRPWFGRCVWECDNDVADDQIVTIEWQDDPISPLTNGNGNSDTLKGRVAKTATFHMIAHSLAQCERRGRIYGTGGEISYDSKTITVHDFAKGTTDTYHPKQMGGGHGGGDQGIVQQYLLAIDAVKSGRENVSEAQREYLGCSLEEVVRSHAMVWAAEDARHERKSVNWKEWWDRVSER
ncbi:NAD(P)-binding protein [Rhizodiscina lignyota]|uniref:NAD(P)-binding protein n=1 Tax=Rhizodiscina lignyota TaxID=1504668 RepID=A0A9P4ICW6_9PEZI|nr:NAD(P)-binding protein [Rhizodiscina lignyota]